MKTSGLFSSQITGHGCRVKRRGIVFDLDGTLVDSLPGIANALNRALLGLALPGKHTLQDVRGFIGNGARALVTKAAPAGASDMMLENIERAFKAEYDLTWQPGTGIYPGVAAMLAALQELGIPLAVLSNKPHGFTTLMVERLFAGVSFAGVLGQRPGIPHKPDPTGAIEAAGLMGLPAGDCLMIGDSTMDMETARRAGMRSVAVTWGYHDRDVLAAACPDAIIDSPAELMALVKSAHAANPRGTN